MRRYFLPILIVVFAVATTCNILLLFLFQWRHTTGFHYYFPPLDSINQNQTSKLFPPSLNLIRQGVNLDTVYACRDIDNGFITSSSSTTSIREALRRRKPSTGELREMVSLDAMLGGKNGRSASPSSRQRPKCSCLDGEMNNNKMCCERCIFWSHKFGAAMVKELFEPHKQQIEICDFEGNTGVWRDYAKEHILEPNTDYRDVIVLRNIYDSLVSGYLYHKSGKECWEDWYGRTSLDKASPFTRDWQRFVNYLGGDDDCGSSRHAYPTLCHYLANQTEEEGMRAYINWVFKAYYHGTFTQWALSRGLSSSSCSHVYERTRTVCFEDLEGGSSKHTVRVTVNSALLFLTNGTSSTPIVHTNPQLLKEEERKKGTVATTTSSYSGGHSTSKDPNLRKRLLKIIGQVDQKYYNNDIRWLDSVLPC